MNNLNIDKERLIHEILSTKANIQSDSIYSDVTVELKERPKYTDSLKQREQ